MSFETTRPEDLLASGTAPTNAVNPALVDVKAALTEKLVLPAATIDKSDIRRADNHKNHFLADSEALGISRR